jgi:AbrB family looped-hinge helix DNA binding protein
MQQFRARVTSKGQLTVPREVRRALGIVAGDEVAFEIGPDGVIVRPARPASPLRAYEGRWRIGSGATVDEIDTWLREIRGDVDEADA